ncbi:MAG TPA: hypothetical protein VMN79_06895 [Casimicrobiaceae bacterium]|nr:hypothetical protein [Casimicrobiaceae bacterium]
MASSATPSTQAVSRHQRRLVLALTLALLLSGQPAGAAEVSVDVRIENGRVPESAQRIRVTEGDSVRLRFFVDRPMTLHLHGYDIERRVAPGQVGEMAFTARATGRFPLHAHGGAAGAGQGAHGEAALLYVEVYPR